MEVLSAGPFRASSILWRPRPGAFALTVAAKLTFQLEPGTSQIAADQEPPNEEDNYWDDDPSRSLYSPSDLAPHKQRADVLLVGSAFAPGRSPVRQLVARVVVGDMEKAIEVFGDRVLTQSGAVREGARFTKMPLRWERAAGGPGTKNPVGVRVDGPPDMYGNTPLPNLQPLGLPTIKRGDFIAPAGFGPIAPSWPDRRERLGRHRDRWAERRWAEQPMPDDVERSYFNAAPLDQQREELRDDEWLVLENLHPEHPRLSTSLPGVWPGATVERRGGKEPLEMRADTIWIDTDRGLCAVTWRGQLRLSDPKEPGRIAITMERGARAGKSGMVHASSPRQQSSPVLPFVPGTSPLARQSSPSLPSIPGEAAADLSPEADPSDAGMTYVEPASSSPVLAPALPFVDPPPPVAPRPALAPPTPKAPAKVAPPPLVRAPARVEPIAPEMKASPWLGVEGRRAGQTIGESAASSAPLPAPASTPLAMRVEPPEDGAKKDPGKEGAKESAGAVAEATGEAARVGGAVRLLWFDAAVAPRLPRQPAWQRLLLESDLRPSPDDPEDEIEDETEEARARRHVFEVLTRGQPVEASALRDLFVRAAGASGKLTPPLALLSGELRFPFDELCALQATVTAVTPLMASDKRLKEAVDTVQELLRTPWLEGSGAIAAGLIEKVEEAFSQGKRVLPPDYLSTHTERILLQKRAYQRRTVFGEERLRALLHAPASSAEGVVAYLPEKLCKELPMMKSIPCRVLVEVDAPQDPFEASPFALRVVAVGRVV